MQCVRLITPQTTLDRVDYWIAEDPILRLPKYDLSPSTCANELTYEVKQKNGSALPASIRFDSTAGSETITVSTSDYTAEGTYTVVVKVTDPKTGLANAASEFEVVIKCTRSIEIISGSISSYSYKIDLDSP